MAVSDSHLVGRLLELTGLSDPDPNVDLILIPAIGAAPVSAWGICQPLWLSMLQQNQVRIRLLEFRYHIPIDDDFSWQLLLDQGANLLRELSRLRNVVEVQKRPILLVCHSLGGCILKQALCIANFQHPKYHLLLGAITGVVFLSTPHSSPTEDSLKEHYLQILRAFNSNITSRQMTMYRRSDASLLTNLAARFQDSNSNLTILSVYENKKTNISRAFSITKKVLLVDLDLARINALQEQFIGLPLTHFDLCTLEDGVGGPEERIKTWLQTNLKHSISQVVDRLKSYQSQASPDLSIDNITPDTAANLALAAQQESADAEHTGQAQQGSSTFDLEVVHLVQSFAPTRKQAVLPCISLGTYPRNREFFGRVEELNFLDSVLLPSQDRLLSSQVQNPRHVTLCGMAGLGKTELALEYAHSRSDKFDAIFWIHADTASKLELDFADIAIKLGLNDAKEPRDLVVDRETAKGWLSKPTVLLDQTHDTVGQTEASWLIVLDNADDPDIVEDYAHIFGSGSWLITSRHPLAKKAFSRDTKVLDLEPFDDHTGAQLLQSLTHASDEENLALTVSHRLGGLPLAITQMAGVIRREYLPLKEFLLIYQEETEHLTEPSKGSLKSLNMLDLELEHRPTRARGTMASIWAIDRLKPASRSLLEAMIFLDPDCIQEYLLKDRCAQAMTDVDFPKRLKTFWAARAALMDSSLLKQVRDETGVRIHRVLQDAVRVQLRRTPASSFADTVAVLCEAWPYTAADKVHDMDRWPRCKELYPHVRSLQAGYKKWFLNDKDVSRFQYAKLLYEAGWYQHATGNSHSIRFMLDEAEQLCQTCGRSQHTQDLLTDIHYALGAIANETNDTQSCVRHTSAFLGMRLQIAEENQTRDLRLAIAYNESGIAKMMSKEYNEAEKCFETAIDVYSALPEFRKDMNTLPHANRGLAAWLKGDFSKAVDIFEQAIRDREELFGFLDKKNFRCGRLWYGLGNVKYSQRDFEGSWQCHQNAFKQAQATIGIRHHRFADICHRIAQHLLRCNLENSKPEHARTYIDQAREIINQALGIWSVNRKVYQPELARSSFLKAKILHCNGEVEDASLLFKEAAQSFRELSGDGQKQDEDLTEEDFDELVTFWSR